MFRNTKFNTEDEFKAVLYKNFREPLCEIPNEYIEGIEYKLEDTSVITIVIPNIITHNNITKKNLLYDKIKPKRHIVINDEERYIINNISIKCDKDVRKKTITANSFEYDLYKKDLTVPDGTFQLYKDKNDAVNINEGVLNWLEKEHKWKVGYIDPKAKSTIGMFDETIDTELYKNLKIINVDKGTVLYDKSVNIDIGNNVLEFSIKYSNITSTDNKSNFIKTETDIEHKFEKFAQPIINIKAIYDLDDSYNDIIRYEFTLKDGFIQKQIQDFTYLRNFDVSFGDIVLTYKTGNKVKKEKVKYRTFEKGNHQWLPFLRDNVAEAFDCLFEFDTINKIINVYDRSTYGQDEGFYLYYEQYMSSVEKQLKISDSITRLIVSGKDGKSIEDVNPLGTNYVENFTYLIKQGNLSENLELALLRYGKYIETVSDDWQYYRNEKEIKDKKSLLIESTLMELQTKLKAQNALKVAYIKSGEDISKIDKDRLNEILQNISELERDITLNIKSLTDLKNEIKELDNKMINCNRKIKKENAKDENGIIFTEDDLNELDECVCTESMEDDYYTDSTELYNNALMILEERNRIPINFKATIKGITQHPRGWKNMIKLGNIAHIVYEDNNEEIEDGVIRVIGFKYIPPKQNAFGIVSDIEFTNQLHKLHDLKTIRNVSKKSEYSKMSVDFWKGTWIDSTISNSTIKNMKEKGIDISVFNIKGGMSNSQIDINNSGIWGIDKENGKKDKQFYIGDSIISVTSDNWENCRTVSDEKGLVAKSIFGTAVVGDRMNMANPQNTFKIDNEGLSIYDNENNLKARIGFYNNNGETKASLLMYNEKGERIIGGDGISQLSNYNKEKNIDTQHNVDFFIPLIDSIQEIREAKLFVHLDKYQSNCGGISDSVSLVTGESTVEDIYINSEKTEDSDIYDYVTQINTNIYDNDLNLAINKNKRHNHIIPRHSHSANYQIVETSLPKNVSININGQIIATNINEDIEMDVTKYLEIKKKNIIRFTSETNGRIESILSLNSFVKL